jgi:hypothetical protein
MPGAAARKRSLLLAVSTAALTAGGPALAAREQALDEGLFVIRRGGEIIGQEQFVIQPGTTRDTRAGFAVTTRAQYPPAGTARSLAALVQFQPDSQLNSARYELLDGAQQVMLVRFTPRRITVRLGRPGRESTREYPGGTRQILADDSLFAPLAILPGMAPGPVTLFSPRSGRRTPAMLVVRDPEPTVIGGERRSLVWVSLRGGADSRDLWFDDRGRLLKVVLPSRDVSAIREPLPPR